MIFVLYCILSQRILPDNYPMSFSNFVEFMFLGRRVRVMMTGLRIVGYAIRLTFLDYGRLLPGMIMQLNGLMEKQLKRNDSLGLKIHLLSSEKYTPRPSILSSLHLVPGSNAWNFLISQI